MLTPKSLSGYLWHLLEEESAVMEGREKMSKNLSLIHSPLSQPDIPGSLQFSPGDFTLTGSSISLHPTLLPATHKALDSRKTSPSLPETP